MKEMRDTRRINKTILTGHRIKHGQRLVISDTEVRGFRAVIGEKSITFILEKKIKGVTRSSTKLTIGSFPSLQVEEARRIALAWSGACEKGEDPRPKKAKQSTDPFGITCAADVTVQVAFEIHRHFSNLSKGTLRTYHSILNVHLTQEKSMTFSELTENHLMAKGKELRQTHGPCMALATLKFLSVIWTSAKRYADTLQISIPGNLVRLMKPGRFFIHETVKKVVPLQDLGRFICFLEGLPERHDLAPKTIVMAEVYLVMLFLGIRISEAVGLRWDELDLEQGFYVLPGERAKNNRSHYKPISKYPLEILEKQKQRRRFDNPYVFPSTSIKNKDQGASLGHRSGLNRLILEETGIDINSHGMRRTYLSLADNLGIPRVARKELVNHRSSDVTDDYSVPSFNPNRGLGYQNHIETALLEIKRHHLAGNPLPNILTGLFEKEPTRTTEIEKLIAENAKLKEALRLLSA